MILFDKYESKYKRVANTVALYTQAFYKPTDPVKFIRHLLSVMVYMTGFNIS